MNRTSWLYLIAEFGPTFSFFIAGRLFSFYVAVAVLMVTTILACLLAWKVERRLPVIPLMSAFFVSVSGVITLFLKQPDAIIFADTLYYLLSAIILGVTLPKGILLLKILFEPVFAVEKSGWEILSWRWFWFLLLAAIANETVRILYSYEFWVDYRFYKTIVVAGFALYQITVMSKHRIPELSTTWGLRNVDSE